MSAKRGLGEVDSFRTSFNSDYFERPTLGDQNRDYYRLRWGNEHDDPDPNG